MRINIFSAAGAGASTLADQLSDALDCVYFDSDDYYWLKHGMPFEHKRSKEGRNELIFKDLARHRDFILSGSVFNWHTSFTTFFDLVVFIYIPPHIRIPRLIRQERERYGALLDIEGYVQREHNNFIKWAAQYDDLDSTSSCSLCQHRAWLAKLDKLHIPVLRIESELDNSLITKKIMGEIERLRLVESKTNFHFDYANIDNTSSYRVVSDQRKTNIR